MIHKIIHSLKFLIILIYLPIYGETTNVVTDVDGNTYNTITIGDQQWIAENLRVTNFRNGDPINSGLDSMQWVNSTQGAYTYYEKNETYLSQYGNLYNWYAASDWRGLCPEGWTVPDESHWAELTETIDPEAWGNRNILGTTLKDQRQVNTPLGGDFDTEEHPRWDEHDKRYGTNNYGFSALPAGTFTVKASYANLGKYAYFWSADEASENYAPARVMLHSHAGTSTGNYPKRAGLSVRCIKEENGVIDPQEYELTISIEGQGTTTPAVGTHSYDENTEVNLTASPDDGWEFEKWVIDGVDVMEVSTQVTMDNDITAVAHFEEVDDNGLPTVDFNGTTLYIQPNDYETRMQWGADGVETGATSTTDGQGNTQTIVNKILGNKGILYAALYCDTLTLAGYEDWYLPALNEMDAIYQDKDVLGGFEYNNYWTSTENGAFFAHRQYFTNGYQDPDAMKINNSGVRCVRIND